MTPSMNSLTTLLDGVRRTLRRDTAVAVGFSALCALPAALLFAWLLGLVRPWGYPGYGPLLLDALVIAAAGVLAYVGMRRWLGGLGEEAVAADAERTAGMPQGTVRGALELSRLVPEGTSSALAQRAGDDIGRRFTGASPHAIAATLRERTRRRRRTATGAFATLSLTALLLAFAAPEHSRAAWSPMASPVRNLVPPPLAPLTVLPGDAQVHRGADLAVRITAPGRDAVTLRWRMQGDIQREEVAPVSGDSARLVIPRIDADAEYWVVAADGSASPRYRVTPTDPLLLADVSVDVVYPRHVGRPTDHYQGEVPPLEVPEGTQLVIRGRATRPLADAGLRAADADHNAVFTTEDERFSGSFTPLLSGSYAWHLRDRTGGHLEVSPTPLDVIVLPDSPPHIEITFPAHDTVIDASMRQAVVADARDDYGLVQAAIVSWRVGRSGETGEQVIQPIEMNGDDRALIRGLLDASSRHLVPGDTLKFFLRVVDSSPRRQTAESRTVALRLPGAVELRERSIERADAMLSEAEKLASAAEDLQQTTRDLERRASAANARRQAERQRGSRTGQNGSQRMDYQEAAAARQMLERQDELVAQLEAMQQDMEALERAMERSGLRDAELQQRLEEMRELYDEMLTPELRQQMEALRNALEELDPQALAEALEQMAQHQEEMKEQLDRSLELMRRAAAEQQMNNLAQEARELATQQEALAQSMAEQTPTAEQAAAQQDLAERTQQLTESLAEMQERLREQGEEQTAESTQEAQSSTAQAGEQMQQAAQDASRQDGEKASEQGAQAAEQLERAAETLDQARQALAEEWKQDAQQSMEQATRDALSLAERQQQLLDRMKQAEQAQQGQSGADQGQQQGQPEGGQQGQQQGGQQQGQQQGGQQGQQQGGQQQGGQQGQQQGGQQQGGQQGQQQGGQQQGGQQQGGQQGGQSPGQQPGGGSGSMQAMRTEQSALQQGLQQLGRNLQENAERSAAMNREVGSSLGQANRSMQQTLDQMQGDQIPTDQAQQTVDALNRLALSLLNNSQSAGEESGEGSQALQQMADIAKKQGDLNGRSNALTPMNVTQNARSQQLNRLSQEQMEIARRLGELNRGGSESMMGDVDALAREAEEIARQMRGGQVPPETLARQERLFHRMLDAGRSLEKDEIEDERTAERPTGFDARSVDALDPALFRDPTRFRAPGAAELQGLPPAYRSLILDYFERLNKPQPVQREGPPPR